MSNLEPSDGSASPLDALKAAFAAVKEHPYCIGSIPLDSNTSTLFYRSGGKSAMINFANATDAQVEALAKECKPASFGLNGKDVLDDSYCKARKMDAGDFSAQFSCHSSGILQTLGSSLLRERHSAGSIHAELYKLNVYGPGSFFKPHVDTPRSDTMFGSLVVVLPTAHEGGSLMLRHAGEEWHFNSAEMVSSSIGPQIAFAAFYSDVEHEVLVVTSGYRVTLTYNLYIIPETTPQFVHVEDPPDLAQMKTSLAELLASSTFLPKGGCLGFGLAYKYPFSHDSANLSELARRHKGSDCAIRSICGALSLDVSLKALYRGNNSGWSDYFCLLDSFVHFGYTQIEDDTLEFIRDSEGGAVLAYDEDVEWHPDYIYEPGYDQVAPLRVRVIWISPLKARNSFETSHIAYGNEAYMQTVYGDVCLIAEVAPFDVRSSS